MYLFQTREPMARPMSLSLAVALLGVTRADVTMTMTMAMAITMTRADVTIDLSKAELDRESGNYCVIQKVRGEGGEPSLCFFKTNKIHYGG